MLEKLATRYSYLAPLFLRLGLAAVFALFSFQKLSDPQQGRAEIQLLLNVGIGPASLLNYYLGLAEGALALSFLFGAFVRYTGALAIVLTIMFFGGIVSKYGFSQDPTLNRDLGLLGGSIALWLLGAGPFSLDARRGGTSTSSALSLSNGPTPDSSRTQKKEPAPELPPPGVLQ